MKIQKTIILFAISLFALCGSFSYAQNQNAQDGIEITEAKMTTSLDTDLMPVNVTEVFPRGTTQVFCWFYWKNASVGQELVAKWYYVTDDLHITDNKFTLPRKAGAGGISLTMPEGKKLPLGLYRIDITKKNQILKSVNFKIK